MGNVLKLHKKNPPLSIHPEEKMSRSENQWAANRIIQYYKNGASRSKLKTAQHFTAEGTPKSTIYKVLSRYLESGETKYKPIPGRPSVKMSPKKVRKVEKAFSTHPNASVPTVARKLKMARSTVGHIKVKKLGITARTMKKSPKYLAGQEERAKKGCRKVYEKLRKKVLIIDDETYVPLDPSQVPGRRFVHARDHSQLEFSQKFKQIAKFPKKFLAWQAIDEIGNTSEPFISEGTMNSQVYLEECLKKRLLPFITQHHEKEDILFWPDLATCHYANVVKEFLEAENLDFVERTENPPNVPQARGIEKFWAECKKAYAQRSDQPKNLRGFRQVWRKIASEEAKKSGKDCMDHAYKWLIGIGYKGLRRAMCDLTNKFRS